jgi:hypothetical protein
MTERNPALFPLVIPTVFASLDSLTNKCASPKPITTLSFLIKDLEMKKPRGETKPDFK